MNRYLWPALMFASFLGCAATIPYGMQFEWLDPHWYPADLFLGAMVVFCGLWMWDGRW